MYVKLNNNNQYFQIMEKKVLTIINDIRAARDMELLKEVTPDIRLREDLGLESFDLAELTVKIEDEFDIDIFEDGLVATIGEIFEKLNKK